MRVRFLVALLAAGAMTPVAAMAQSAVGGAVTGAAVGAAVGGPVGAVVGAGVGGTVGVAIEPPPPPVVTYVQREDIPSVTVQKEVVVGEVLPATVELHTIPKYKKYRFAVINHKRVIVAPKTRKVIKIID
jgi:hypothetical protein